MPLVARPGARYALAMRPIAAFCMTLMLASVAQADPRTPLYGTWGTAAQCTGALIKPGGTRRATPFELRPGWLRHGGLWCRLAWFPPIPRDGGLFAGAIAHCGEDSARSYRLGLSLAGDELTLIWDDALANGPLRRCPG